MLLGHMVHFRRYGACRAALITRDWGSCVNLAVLLDGSTDTPLGVGLMGSPIEPRTSISKDGSLPGTPHDESTWHWPGDCRGVGG